MRVRLTVIRGPHSGKNFEFDGHDTFLVGRGSSAHFRLSRKDQYFSRVHFMVEVNPPQCRLTDMGSTNGTFLNREQVEAAALKHGDVIHGGETAIRVAIVDDPSSAEIDVRRTRQEPAQRDESAAPADVRRTIREALPSAVSHGVERVAEFEILKELGRGGMGVVYLAQKDDRSAPVALKMIQPQVPATRRDVERFLREASILGKLDHANAVRFFELGEDQGQLYFVMEYVPGYTAAEILDREGPLSIRRAIRWTLHLLDALDYAHSKQFVHRDVKPANLLVTEDNGSELVKLADFGLARVYQASRMSGLTMQGDMGGSMAFVAPEQITHFREARPAGDIYSATATLYNLLTGKHTFDFPKAFHQQVLMVLHDTPIPVRDRRSDIPAELASLIETGLRRDPSKRFPSARAMRDALRQFVR